MKLKPLKNVMLLLVKLIQWWKTVNSYVVRQQKLFTAYEKENNLKGIKHTKAEIASANHLDVKLKKAIESFNREKKWFWSLLQKNAINITLKIKQQLIIN
jgi:hypothetical protein